MINLNDDIWNYLLRTSMLNACPDPNARLDFQGICSKLLSGLADLRQDECCPSRILLTVPLRKSLSMLFLHGNAWSWRDEISPRTEECPRELQSVRLFSKNSYTHEKSTLDSLRAESPISSLASESFPIWEHSKACRSCSRAECRAVPLAQPTKFRKFGCKFQAFGPFQMKLSKPALAGIPCHEFDRSKSGRPSSWKWKWVKLANRKQNWKLTWCLWLQCSQFVCTNGPVGIPYLIEFGFSGFFFLTASGCSVKASHPVHW